MNTPRNRSIQNYLLPVFRFKWRTMALLAATMVSAVLWLHFTPRQYESEAKLFVRVGRENASLDPTVQPDESIGLSSASREAEMNSIVEHLRSRAILEKALAVLQPGDANASPEEREKRISSLNGRVDVSSPRSSTVVVVRCRADSPHDAQKTVAALVDVYLDEHMRINRSSGSHEFFLEQSRLLKDQLKVAQAALRDAKNKAGMASTEGRRNALEGQISAVETQIHQTSAALAASQAKTASLEVGVGSLPEPLIRQMVGGTPNDGLASMEEQLFQLRIREREIFSKYTQAHPLAIAIREQIREVEEALKREEPDRQQIVSAVLAQEVANQASLSAQEKKLQAQLAELRNSLVTLNQDSLVIEGLTRDAQQLETKYLAYVASMEETRMDQALRADRISNVSIIQSASFVPTPVRPRTTLVLFLAFLGGSLGSIAVALVSERLDQTLRTCEDVAANLGLPGLGTIPRMPHRQVAPARKNGAGVSSED